MGNDAKSAGCPRVATRPLAPSDIVQAVKHLPSAPQVLPRIKRLLTDCNSSIEEIVELIRLDPGMAAQVVRVGNSAYYSSGASCSTVEEAVGRVGFNQVYELASYAAAAQVLIRPLAVYGIEADDFWLQSLAGAFAAEVLAQRTGQDASTAYTIGLLHGIGMVAIDEWALRSRRGLRLSRDEITDSASASEQAQLGFTQADTGAALLCHWGFPAEVCAAMRGQDDPATADHTCLAALLHTAKFVRSAACQPDRAPPRPSAPVLALLPLPANSLPAIIAEVVLRLKEVSPLLEIATMAAAVNLSDRTRFPVDGFHH
jgi:HD-like signal output (HDOD) protein